MGYIAVVDELTAELAALRREVAELRRRIDRLERPGAAGVEPPPIPAAQRVAEPVSRPAVAQVPAYERAAAARAVEPAARDVSGGGLELALGLRWTAWLGGLALIVAAGLGVKLAYDAGLLNLPPAARLAVVAAIGAGLMAGGAVARRRVHPATGAGLSAAGLAVLFICAFAAHAYYGLVGPTAAFALAAVVAAIGLGASAADREPATGTLAVVGAGLAPLLLGEGGGAAGLCGFLLVVQAMALGVAARGGGGPWWAVRGAAGAVAGLWGVAMAAAGAAAWVIVPWAVVAAILFHAESFLAARRRDAERPLAVTAGALATLWATTIGLAATAGHGDFTRAAGLLLAAGVGAGVAWAARRRPLFGRAYFVQAVALTAVAVPVAVGGAALAACWAIFALVLAAAAFATRHVLPFGAAVALWLLSAAALAAYAVENPGVGFGLAGTFVPNHVVLAAGLAGALVAVVMLGRRTVDDDAVAAAAGVALVTFAASAVGGLPWLTSTLALAVAAAGVWAAGQVVPSRALVVAGGIGVLATAIKWLGVDVLRQLDAGFGSIALWHPPTQVGFALVALLAVVASYRTLGERRVDGHAAVIGLVALGIVAVSLEIHRLAPRAGESEDLARQVGLSGAWSLAAAGLVAAGLAADVAALRRVGLGLLGVTGLKVMAVDLTVAEVGAGGRVASFVVLGVVLLTVSVLYAKLANRRATPNGLAVEGDLSDRPQP